MTQIKEGFSRSPDFTYAVTNTDDSISNQNKKPSPELFEMIQAAASSLRGFAQLWESIRKKGTSEGFTETQLQDLIKPLLKAQLHMSKEQIWYMFNKEKKAIANKEAYDSRRINLPIADKKEPEQISTPEPEEVEEPTENELLKIENEQLKDALHKTQMFKPATDVSLHLSDPQGIIEKAILTEDIVFDWLEKRDNGVNCYYYPNYGIELFRNRILTQLKNKGVTTFKRLYFEV